MPVDLRRGPAWEPEVRPVSQPLSQINLAAGAVVDLDTFNITEDSELVKVNVASSVACKWEIKTVHDGIVSTEDTLITDPGSGVWDSPLAKGYFTYGNFVKLPGGPASNFRITVTNLDSANAANVYATVYWNEETI